MSSRIPRSARGVPADRNPFRIDRLESLAFRPHAPGQTADDVVQRFRDAGWHGAVVGPHGSGKSTLLKRLVAEAAADGHSVISVFFNRQTPRRERRAEVSRVVQVMGTPDPVIACDGWSHLPPWERRRLRRAARRSGARLVGLAHLCGWGLPVVYRTRTSPALFASLVDELRVPDDPGVEVADAATHAAWKGARGNVRDALLALYDRSAAGG